MGVNKHKVGQHHHEKNAVRRSLVQRTTWIRDEPFATRFVTNKKSGKATREDMLDVWSVKKEHTAVGDGFGYRDVCFVCNMHEIG